MSRETTGRRPGPRAIGDPDSSAVRQHGIGRVCAGDGCTTVLSRYNEAEHCYTCQASVPGAAPKVRMPRAPQARRFSTR